MVAIAKDFVDRKVENIQINKKSHPALAKMTFSSLDRNRTIFKSRIGTMFQRLPFSRSPKR
jgi:hypothetical protein